MPKVLLCETNSKIETEIKNFLTQAQYEVFCANNGKEAQLIAYKHRLSAAIIDFEIKNNSSLSVIKYLKVNFPSLKIILLLNSIKQLEELELKKSDLPKLGICESLVRPFKVEILLKVIDGQNLWESWKTQTLSPNSHPQKNKMEAPNNLMEIAAHDHEFTHIPIQAFFSGSITIFDYYIRLSKNRYVCLLKKGDRFGPDRLDQYKEKGVQNLYFKTSERGVYINFMNEILKKIVESDKVPSQKKVDAIASTMDQYIDEVYTRGLREEVVEEGKKLCERTYNFLSKDKNLLSLFKSWEKIDKQSYSHQFLVTFFSVLICKNLNWVTISTIDKIAQGALLHDIGKLKLPPHLMVKMPHEMNIQEIKQYEQHPTLGLELLSKYSFISEATRQIIYQHHELSNGEGFPNKLTNFKIYPLAKIVALADHYAHTLTKEKLTPIEGLTLFIKDKNNNQKFDPTMVKALIQGFMS